ncbi:MAG: DUF1800 family protein, partial [Actinomycetota bacterium]
MPIEPIPRNAAHLLRRAAFGGTPDEIARVTDEGIEATVDRLLDPSDAPPFPRPHRTRGEQPFEEWILGAAWMRLAATSPTPAIERLSWFWQGHFATGVSKVEWTDLLHAQWAMLRHRSLGRFDDLLHAVVHDAAMNLYLDLHTSVAGRPNENFAREVMELFSMGAGRGYTQSDVVEAGRAFTGYGIEYDRTIHRAIGSRLLPALHDTGTKRILGSTGAFDGLDVVRLICATDACHRFVPERLWFRYAGTTIPDEVADELSSVFAADLRIDHLVRAMLVHPRFYDDDVRAGLVDDPVSLVVRTVRGFGIPIVEATGSYDEMDRLVEDGQGHHPELLADLAGRMGQRPGNPPNVGGWGHNTDWLDSNSAAGRLLIGTQLGEQLAIGELGPAEQLLGLTRDARALTAALAARFGVVEVGDE